MLRSLLPALLVLLPATLRAQPPAEPPDFSGEELLPVVPLAETKARREENLLLFENLRRDPVVFALVAEKPGLSFHKPMFFVPYSWTHGIRDGEPPEALFQLSFKQRLLDYDIYFAYSQKSFWQVYDGARSRPFRETDYNPEVFYRWKPDQGRTVFGFDVGAEHESNGQNIPDSRSWNRLYVAGFREGRQMLAYLKLWYRLPEDEDRAIDDPKRDDNPDISDYMGYGELLLQRNLFGSTRQRAGLMTRFNPATGKGALQLNYSAPLSNYAFWNVYLWHGYGESLLDYDRETSRIGVGMMFSR
jgi:phospholipase A1